MRNRIKLDPCSLHANVGSQTAYEIASDLVRPHGHPKARAKGVESRRHDPDERPWGAAQDKALAKNVWIGTEFSLPKPVIHYKHGCSAGAAIFFRDRATQQRRHAQIIKSVRRYGLAGRQNAGEFAVIIEEPANDSMSNHVFEDMILFAEGAEFLG